MTYYGDCESSEVIRNCSTCVKEGSRIRNIGCQEDIDKGLLVFVNMIVQHGEHIAYDIKPYTKLRYAIINHSWR